MHPWALVGLPGLLALTAALAGSCSDDEPAPGATVSCGPPSSFDCERDDDCPLREICSIGVCVTGCRPDGDRCGQGEECIDMRCVPAADGGPTDAPSDGPDSDGDGASVECPADMVAISLTACMDRHEASRPDATETSFGADGSMATSREGVLPWYPITKSTAAAACAAAGKRLCSPEELTIACSGPTNRRYVYGDQYEPTTCNGSDTFCNCGAGSACESVEPCPYPGCFHLPPEGQSTPATGCGAPLHVLPTGSFPDCVSPEGIYDLTGNVWELVDDGTTEGQFRAGAFNCIDSESLHQCSYVGVAISAKGFRCCR